MMSAARSVRSNALTVCPICTAPLAPLGITETYDLRPAVDRSVSIDFAICTACGFVCQSNVPSRTTLARYYDRSPRHRSGSVSESERSLYADQARFMLESAELRSKRVLDIGADMGKLLDVLRDDYACETSYEELNAEARAWMRKRGRPRGRGPHERGHL
jgi:transcription elongation factor Elf1